MRWTLQQRGFLPTPDPLTEITGQPMAWIQALTEDLPELVHEGTFRQESVRRLNRPFPWELVEEEDPYGQKEKLFQAYSYFASAFVHAPGQEPVTRLPKEIAIPLATLGEQLRRPPILAYPSYCLNNWQRIDRQGPIALGNIELVQNFAFPKEGKRDEDWFILVHVEIEARAGTALTAMAELAQAMAQEDPATVKSLLVQLKSGLAAMNKTLDRMPEQCSPDVYFKKVRPYIFGFNDLVYDGCFDDKPVSFRGETGAQSSIVPAVLSGLGLKHEDSLLTRHLDDMRNYMPVEHREFIESLAPVRAFAVKHKTSLSEAYNGCLDELLAFRQRHFEYAVNYIHKKVANPLATGGTPYIPWLNQLIEETKTGYL
ncbi:MAG: hypothetical protein EXR99_10170 [Gemmataceae bacterium]|nr:hypothetical protein [Gemmataceae bacterium]